MHFNRQFTGILFFKKNKSTLSENFNLQVHYYEDGNVQLVSSKDVKQTINISVSTLFFFNKIKINLELEK